MISSRPPPFGSLTTDCSARKPNGPIASMCGCCTWRPRPRKVKWRLPCRCCLKPGAFQLATLARGAPLQSERLRRAAFLETAMNVIAAGSPGVGKSHALAAVGYGLVLAGHPVLWTSPAALVQRLLAAKRDLRLPQELAKLDRFACVSLDDIGYVQQNRDEMEVLFTFLSERYERKSVMITTNLVFSAWQRIFKDPMTTMAAIDRVVHHSVILDMMSVGSYRAEVANQQQQRKSEEAEVIAKPLSTGTSAELTSAKLIPTIITK